MDQKAFIYIIRPHFFCRESGPQQALPCPLELQVQHLAKSTSLAQVLADLVCKKRPASPDRPNTCGIEFAMHRLRVLQRGRRLAGKATVPSAGRFRSQTSAHNVGSQPCAASLANAFWAGRPVPAACCPSACLAPQNPWRATLLEPPTSQLGLPGPRNASPTKF